MILIAMIAAAIAARAPTTTASDNSAAEMCRVAFAQKLGIRIGSISVAGGAHTNGWTVLRGSFSGYRPPAPPAPGMAAPLHVISLRYDYHCWVYRGVVRKTSERKID